MRKDKFMSKRYLLLEDGTYFEGKALGSDKFKIGDLVFNTSMSGYQDILKDTAYSGQVIVMTYPMVGNYGINRDGFDSVIPSIYGLVIGEHCDDPSNFSCQMTLDEFLKLRDIPAIRDLDTRMVVRYIRKNGIMKAALTDSLDDLESQLQRLKESQEEENLVEEVSITKAFHIPASGKRLALIDFGSINEIIRQLIGMKLDITVLPYTTTAKEIESLHVDGIILSNGPGDPSKLKDQIACIKYLLGNYPILGIGLGHQLLALACGARVDRMRLGHRGANYPIKNLETGKIEIHTTNNSFTVAVDSLKDSGLEMTYQGHDGTCEGLVDEKRKLLSIQFCLDSSLNETREGDIFQGFYFMLEMRNHKDGSDK